MDSRTTITGMVTYMVARRGKAKERTRAKTEIEKLQTQLKSMQDKQKQLLDKELKVCFATFHTVHTPAWA